MRICTASNTIDNTGCNTACSTESYAQVAASVLRSVLQKACGLKPISFQKKKSEVRCVRWRTGEIEIVKTKAQIAGISFNSFVRASALGSDDYPPIDKDLQNLLLATNRQLAAQGNNLNQIAKYLYTGQVSSERALGMLDSSRNPLVRALLSVKDALAPEGSPS